MALFKKNHRESIRMGHKTQTRRRIKKSRLKIGKIYRVKKDFYHCEDFDIKILDVREERLGDISEKDAWAEGHYTIEDYKNVWKDIYGEWDPEELVLVYEFEMVEHEDKMPRGAKASSNGHSRDQRGS